MLSPREQFICLLDNKPSGHADVIVCLEGGGLSRAGHAAKLWKEGRAKSIFVTGGLDKPPFSIPSPQMKYYLMGAGIPAPAIIFDIDSMNTWEQATTAVALAKLRPWRSAILVASDYHQYRAYLTFLKAMQKANYKLRLTSATVRCEFDIPTLNKEFDKIEEYQAGGHCASFEEGLEHLFNA